MIAYISNKGIDREKWDNCLSRSGMNLEYTHAWYLDLVCPDWDGLVMNDYEAVMPLCRKSRFGIDYLFQPFLAQQMGVFSSTALQSRLVDEFLSAIPPRYKWVDIHMNEMNPPEHTGFVRAVRRNFAIEMTGGYGDLRYGFSRNCIRNLRKAEKAGLVVREDLSAQEAVTFLSSHLSIQVRNLDRSFFDTLGMVVRGSMGNGSGWLLSVQKPDAKEVIAAGWFLKNDSRVCFQACASSPEGKAHEAMYLLVDHALKRHASSGLTFDFTGSNLPGVAYFNASFGARPRSYTAVFRNSLPFPLNILKGNPAWVNPSGQL